MSPRRPTLLTRVAALVWLLVVLGAGIWVLARIAAGPVVNADLLSLLPGARQEPGFQAAARSVQESAERKLVLVISAGERAVARAAARHVTEQLAESEQFAHLDLRRDAADLRQLGAFYFPYRSGLLSPETRRELLAGDEETFRRQLLSRYLNPLAGLSSGLVEADPLLLLPDFLASLAPAETSLQLDDGFLTAQEDGSYHVLLLEELIASPFSMTLQDALAPRLEALRRELGATHGAQLMVAGVFPHAAAGTASARREVSIVGLGSLAGIFVLFLAVFRSPRPLLLGGFAVAVGCLTGFAACLAFFGQVHLLTLVFGASLVGISVDYALHYFCERLADGGAAADVVLRRVFPGITLGLVTSVVGFAGILMAPFPGLREMAVFSSIGLIGAWLCVVLFYPVVPQGRPRSGGKALQWARSCGRFWESRSTRSTWSVLTLLLLVAVAGCLKLTPLDDFRLLQARDTQILAEDERVRHLLGQDHASQFFLVRGDDAATVLEREEGLLAALQPLVDKGELRGYTALSRFVPSPARQQENRRLIDQLVAGDSGLFETLVQTIGLPEGTRAAYAGARGQSGSDHVLTMHDWLETPAAAPLRHLWVTTEGGPVSVVSLSGVSDAAALRQLAAAHDDLRFVDRVGELSEVFAAYRSKTLWLTGAAYLAVALLLLLRYGMAGALGIMAVPLAAALAAFGALGYLSEPISLFNVMALLLVLGIGVDYGIFFREDGRVRAATLLAVALSAATTILAFGLLAVSATAAVHSFGLTLLIGISVAFLLSPLAARRHRSSSPSQAAGVSR